MPSYFESLSMVTLEAWALGRPVLANGACDVLKGQCLRSNAGLFYDSYDEFAEALGWFARHPAESRTLGDAGRAYYRAALRLAGHRGKYMDMFERLSREPAPGERGAGGAAARGGGRGARPTLRPARYVVEALPAGPVSRRGGSRGEGMTPSVHQVLATLSYGDAIGNEVLAIRASCATPGTSRRSSSGTADSRLEDLTQDYRDLPAVQPPREHPHPPLLARVEDLAHRVRAARPDDPRLPQRHAARVLRGHPPAARARVLPRPARAVGIRAALRPRAGRLGVQPAGTGGDGIPGDRCAAGRPRLLAPEGRAGPAGARRLRRRDHERRLRRPAGAQQADRRRHPDLRGVSTLLQPALAPADRRQPVGVRALLRSAPVARRAARRPAGALPRPRHQQRVDGLLRRGGRRSCARASTRASASRSSRRSGKGVPVLAYAAAAVPATMDGAGVLFKTKDPYEVAGLVNQVTSNAALRDAIVEAQDGALARLMAKDFRGTLLGFVDRVLSSPAPPAAPGRRRLLGAGGRHRALRGTARLPPGARPRAAEGTARRWSERFVDRQIAESEDAHIHNDDDANSTNGSPPRTRTTPSATTPAACRRLLRDDGPRLRAVLADDRRGTGGRRAAVRRSRARGGVTSPSSTTRCRR